MNENAPPPASFSLGRILTIVVPVGLILLAFLGYTRYGEELGLAGTSIPKVVTVKGKVMMRGKPVSGGTIQTYFLDNAALQGGFGRIKEDGTFVLETPVEAEIQEGLFVGNHKVVIYNYLPSAGAAAGPLTTPTQYSTPEQTPLKLKVTKETAGTPLEFMLEADEDTPTEAFVEEYLAGIEDAQAAAAAMSAARPSGPPVDNNGPAAGGDRGRLDPAAFFESRDSDGNGVLAGDEIPAWMDQRLADIDTNGDGEISKAEMEAARPQADDDADGDASAPDSDDGALEDALQAGEEDPSN
ncbi:MAG: hypothetical protein ACON32_00610 [Pirellulaceae bacterium]